MGGKWKTPCWYANPHLHDYAGHVDMNGGRNKWRQSHTCVCIASVVRGRRTTENVYEKPEG